MPYTGNIMNRGRYPTMDLSTGLRADHSAGAEPDDPDLWRGSAAAGPGPDYGSPGVWVDSGPDAPHTGERVESTSHWSDSHPGLTPTRLGWVDSQYVARDQMMAAHSHRDPGTERSYPREAQFTSAGLGTIVNRQQGQASWEPGLSGPLARGSNSYAQNNPASEVYGGEGMRLGYDVLTWGEYRSPTKQISEYHLRALAREEVAFPVDTPAVPDPAPYTPFGTGTMTQLLPYGSRPRLFAAPGPNAMSEASMAAAPPPAGEFASDGWG
jgi:hypothetical protein